MLNLPHIQLDPPSDWKVFEHWCWRLWRAEWGDRHIRKNGRQGQPQAGVDVYGHLPEGGFGGIQCKGKDRLTAKRISQAELLREVRKARNFVPAIREFILATTAPRDVRVQQWARDISSRHQEDGEFRVEVIAWEDFLDLLSLYPDVVAELYIGSPAVKHAQELGSLVSSIKKIQSSQTKVSLIAAFATTAPKLHGQILDALEATDDELLVEFGRQISKALTQTRDSGVSAKPTSPATLLPQSRLRVLGLIATAPIPMPRQYLQWIFPDIDWSAHVRYLKQQKLITETKNGLGVSNTNRRRLTAIDADRTALLNAWVAALEQLRDYPDMCVFLALTLLKLDRFTESVQAVIEGGESSRPSVWNNSILGILETLDEPRMLRKLEPEWRLRFVNSLGLSLFGAGRHTDALKCFQRLYRNSRRNGSDWGVGQALYHQGLVHQADGSVERSASFLERSVEHCESANDFFLLGRSLYQLAMVVADSDADRAEALLERSEAARSRAGDSNGVYATQFGRGMLAVAREDHEGARKSFEAAARTAKTEQDGYAYSLALNNEARSCVDLGNSADAIPLLRDARSVALREGYDDVLAHVLGTLAVAADDVNNWKVAVDAFLELHTHQLKRGNVEEAAAAIHDAGAARAHAGQYEKARRLLSRAAQFARRHNVQHWVAESIVDLALATNRLKDTPVARQLCRHARREEKRELWTVAAKVWTAALEWSIRERAQPGRIRAIASSALRASGNTNETFSSEREIRCALYEWNWTNGEFEAAQQELSKCLVAAVSCKNSEWMCRLEDQIGVGLQELGRYDEAVARHRSALAVAKSLDDGDLEFNCLNNLGLGLRHLDRLAEAAEVMQEAVALAKAAGDIESAISATHNQSLALQENDPEMARKLLDWCRKEARKYDLSEESVRALHGLGNLLRTTGETGQAIRRYRAALREASSCGLDAEVTNPIRLNLSEALESVNRFSEALTVINEIDESVREYPDAFIYYAQLAELNDKTEQSDAAEGYWHLTLAAGQRVGDRWYVSLAAGVLGERNLEREEYETAGRYFEIAIATEDGASGLAGLLANQLHVCLELNNKKMAQACFERVQDLHGTADCAAPYIDSLMLVGDYAWTGDDAAEAMKAYLAASLVAISEDVNWFVDIGAHACAQLRSLGVENREQLGAIERDTRKKLKVARRLDDEWRMMSWPFRAAERILDRDASGKAVSPTTAARICMEECGDRRAKRTHFGGRSARKMDPP